MNDENLIARRKATLGPTYQNFYDKPLHLVRGSGTRLWDVDGRVGSLYFHGFQGP